MSSSILHQCPFCGLVSDISLTLAAFIENPHCTQCGLSVSESNGKLQDELAALFDRQMTMEQLPSAPKDPVSFSITQHYHHSSHVASPHPSPAVSTPLTTTLGIHDILAQHGLDPTTLSPSQLDLFRHADAEQQQRLIQTWQLYSRSERGDLVGPTSGLSAPQYTQPPPSYSAGDLEMSESVEEAGDDHMKHAEPYMISGYETGTERVFDTLPKEPTTGEPYASATDPVYRSQQWWESAQVGPMESRYGVFEEKSRYYSACGVVQPRWLCQD